MSQNRTLYAVLAFTGACLITNGLVFGLGFDSASAATTPRLAPPGWVIGLVWVGLFAIMGVIYARVARPGSALRWLLIALAAFSLAYPFYTEGLSNLQTAFIGNIVTLAVTLAIAWRLSREDRTAGALLLPMSAWLTFATYLTADGLALV
ncbi:MAG: TspO/MBR family protein [Hyphomicrobiales bacterium]|nr:TspO/MBR family protein [Hyphomicrobiales bacterium]